MIPLLGSCLCWEPGAIHEHDWEKRVSVGGGGCAPSESSLGSHAVTVLPLYF